jgi:hypothetical protein
MLLRAALALVRTGSADRAAADGSATPRQGEPGPLPAGVQVAGQWPIDSRALGRSTPRELSPLLEALSLDAPDRESAAPTRKVRG